MQAGGGGASYVFSGGAGGGINGKTYYNVSPPGTQTSGYMFGLGQNGEGVADSDGVAGGGSGYYGGCSRNVSRQSAGSGGSGYISGHLGCIAIMGPDHIQPKVTEATDILDSYHYSNKIFTNTSLIDGDSVQPMFNDQTQTTKGNADNGYCKITKIN